MRAKGLSAALLLVIALLGAAAIVHTFGAQYPVRDWLMTRVLGYWALALYWSLGCLGVGVWLVERIAPRRFRLAEKLVVGFALGVLAFGLLVFGAGLVHGLNRAFFWLAPALLLASGLSSYPKLFAALRARLITRKGPPPFLPAGVNPAGPLHPRGSLRSLSVSPIALIAVGYLALGLTCVYLPILSPSNIQHDARWYHLTLAQQYATQGAVERFPEGWFLGAYPQLASYLYAWAMLWPAGLIDKLALCAHLELMVFLATLLSTPVLLRRVLQRRAADHSAVVLACAGFFLFPGFLVYDSTLSLGADHVAALWAPAGLLALLVARRTLHARDLALVGVFAAAAALTKYSALCVVAPLLSFAALSACVRLARAGQRKRVLLGVLALGASFALVWSPHWLKNFIWYGDPLYPALHERLGLHPWNASAAGYFELFTRAALLRPTHDLAGLAESVRAALSLGFSVSEYGFHAEIPTFGFLFAATLYCLPFVRPRSRVWLVYGLGLFAALTWYWTNHRDRYLQACLPWLVVGTLAVLWHAWQLGIAGKLAASALIAAQLACGAAVFFIPSHAMLGNRHALPHVLTLIASGFSEPQRHKRFELPTEWSFADWHELGRELKHGDRVLVHEDRLWLGLNAPVVVDEAAWQAGIRYAMHRDRAAIYDLLHGLRVTHIVTGRNHPDGGDQGVFGDLLFWDFVTSSCTRVTTAGKQTLWKMPAARPRPSGEQIAVLLTCKSAPATRYAFGTGTGWRVVRSLADSAKTAPIPDDVLEGAALVASESDCSYALPASLGRSFERMTQRYKVTLWRAKAKP